jgi:hypothetical protein
MGDYPREGVEGRRRAEIAEARLYVGLHRQRRTTSLPK